MNDDYYHSSDYKIQLGPVDATPNDANVDNLSEIPAPTPAPTPAPAPAPALSPTPINDVQSNSSCPFEKPYYEISETKLNQQPIIPHKNCCARCFDRYDDISIYFIRIFLILTIQYILITSFTLIIFVTKFGNNYESYKKENNLLIPSIGLITIIIIISIYFRILCMNENSRKNKALYIYIVFYIFAISYFCSFIRESDAKYVFLFLISEAIDSLGILLYITIFTFKSFKFIIAPVITSIIEIIFIHFYWNLTLNETFYMSIVALILIIYIGFLSRQCKKYFKTDEYIFAVLIMNYLIFSIWGSIFYGFFKKYIKVSFMRRENCTS